MSIPGDGVADTPHLLSQNDTEEADGYLNCCVASDSCTAFYAVRPSQDGTGYNTTFLGEIGFIH